MVQREPKVCLYCKKEFNNKDARNIYCGRRCCSLASVGKKLSPETIEKLRISHIGHKASKKSRDKMSRILKEDYKSGKRKPSNAMKGKQHTPETKKKMSLTRLKMAKEGLLMKEGTRKKLSKLNIGKMAGELHPNWRGGLSEARRKVRKGVQYKLWRDSVFARDNWTCQCCKERGSIVLNAHHIKGYSQYKELRTNIGNGITLCERCHRLYHKEYGRVGTEENLGKFLRDTFPTSTILARLPI